MNDPSALNRPRDGYSGFVHPSHRLPLLGLSVSSLVQLVDQVPRRYIGPVTDLDGFALGLGDVESPNNHGSPSRYDCRLMRELDGTAGNAPSSSRSESRMC